MSSKPWRSGRVWQALCRQVYAEESHCYLCLRPIDFNARPRTRWSKSVDHILPVDTHPHLALVRSNLAAAHYGCNSRKGAGPAPDRYEPSREW